MKENQINDLATSVGSNTYWTKKWFSSKVAADDAIPAKLKSKKGTAANVSAKLKTSAVMTGKPKTVVPSEPAVLKNKRRAAADVASLDDSFASGPSTVGKKTKRAAALGVFSSDDSVAAGPSTSSTRPVRNNKEQRDAQIASAIRNKYEADLRVCKLNNFFMDKMNNY